MNAISDGDRLDDRAGDWFFIFHTLIMDGIERNFQLIPEKLVDDVP